MLGRYGPHLRPKSVVMAFFEGNDWENLDDELKQPYLRQALATAARFGSPTLPEATIRRAERVISGWLSAETPGAMEVFERSKMMRNFVELNYPGVQLGTAYPKTDRKCVV